MKSLVTLKSSKDFLEAKKGLFYRSRSFLLQAFEVKNSNEIKVGYTVSKQNGNAVVRNKIKRRLRVLANTVLANYGIKKWNYVIIGKKNVMVGTINNKLELYPIEKAVKGHSKIDEELLRVSDILNV